MDKFREMELFVQVADLGSLSLAAERLGMSNPAASRLLQGLEARLGVRLVERTTRRLGLTDAGRQYHNRCTTILSEVDDANAEVMELATAPKGTLRVTSSVSFAMLHIAPGLTEFRKAYPQLAVQVTTSNRYHDFIDAGIDIAIRTREFEVDSNITVRKLADTHRVLAASPAYFELRGRPQFPDDITNHDMLVYNLANQPHVLNFQKGNRRQTVRIASAIDSNEGQVLRAAALSGAGILVQPLFTIYDDICAGRLIPALTDWQLPPLSINIAYQSRQLQPAKIAAFTSFMKGRFDRLEIERMWERVRQSL